MLALRRLPQRACTLAADPLHHFEGKGRLGSATRDRAASRLAPLLSPGFGPWQERYIDSHDDQRPRNPRAARFRIRRHPHRRGVSVPHGVGARLRAAPPGAARATRRAAAAARRRRAAPLPARDARRPRGGWHLDEKHVTVDGHPISGALFDFGLFFFHNAKQLIAKGTGPYFYLPKLESHLEARLWNDVFNLAQDELGIPRGTIRATVLIETILAAFEMDEILYELRDHSSGLNAGRWDYIFSIIKKFRKRPEFVLPDRAQVTMTVPFMRAYTELLVKTCHRRGAHAMGGMAAFIPSRRDPEVNRVALSKVKEDKDREAGDGFDGTWVAHPDLVATATEAFDRVLGDRPNQLERQRPEVSVKAAQLIDVKVPGGTITENGVRTNVSVGIQYIESWMRGTGAAAINNLMEDVATAEISRSQVWQWVKHASRLDDGAIVTADLVREIADDEMSKLRERVGEEGWKTSRFTEARKVFDEVALSKDFQPFLTLVALKHIN